jgi:hypothetical protein
MDQAEMQEDVQEAKTEYLQWLERNPVS